MTTHSALRGPVSSNPVCIATHNGVFHADDVLAVAALTIYYSNAPVVRTRDAKAIDAADIVVDVGAKYSPESERFDHHQAGRAGQRANGVLYSSFGLVWRHYASRITAAVIGDIGHAALAFIGERIDRELVQPIDAIDNGQNLYVGGSPAFEGVSSFSLSAVISSFNPSWHEVDRDFDAAFRRAVEFARELLIREIRSAHGTFAARDMVEAAVTHAQDKRVISLPQFAPWTEQVRDEHKDVLFVVYPSETGTWMVQTVPVSPGSFKARMDLPAAWAGLRGSAFAEVVGIADAVFAHPGRFICGFETRASAEKAAQLALL